MKKLYTLAFFGMLTTLVHAQVSVTLQVDMNEQTVSADGVHVAGEFQGWDPMATPMSDDDMDGVWEVTLDLAPGTHQLQVHQWHELGFGRRCTSNLPSGSRRK